MAGVVAAGMVAMVAGCGFEPLYGSPSGREAATAAIQQVKIAPVPDRSGQVLHNFLLDQVNPKGAPLQPIYELATKLTEEQRELAFRRDEVATRVNMTLAAEFRLIRLADGRVMLHEMVRATHGFNRLHSGFATISAETEARRRAARELSEEIRTRLALYLTGQSARQP